MPDYLQLILAALFGAGLAAFIGALLSKRVSAFKASGSVTLSGVTWAVDVVQTAPNVAELNLSTPGGTTAKAAGEVITTTLEVK